MPVGRHDAVNVRIFAGLPCCDAKKNVRIVWDVTPYSFVDE